MGWKKCGGTAGALISAAGLLALLAVMLLWWRGSSYGFAGRTAAILSAALFAAGALRSVPGWMRFWSREMEPELCFPDEPPHMLPRLFAAGLALDALFLLLVHLLRRLSGADTGFFEGLEFWTCLDSGHYLDIARDWYLSEGEWDRLVQLVFLPGYPLLIRLFMCLTGDALSAGLLAAALCFAAALCVLYRLLRLDAPHAQAMRTLRYLCILPGAFFFAAPMSESLFLLLTAACLFCARTGRWTRGCLLGGCAAFTRSLGLTLLVPLLFELISTAAKGAQPRGRVCVHFAALLLVPAGFGVYLLVNCRVSGNPFQFLIYQSEHWGQRTGWFFNTAAYQTEYAISCLGTNGTNLLGLWLPNLLACFGALVVIALSARRLRTSYLIWFFSYYLLAIGATWLLSAPRYLTVLFPIHMGLSALTARPCAERVVTLCGGALSLLYLCAFVLRWQVW
ncbi:MAG: hypothetical protein LUC21_01940 [Oscillospiraceae bacterium]|nr:hypothetical protein [Oscillospiraceae bacterium]